MEEKLYYNLCNAEQRKEYFKYRRRKVLQRNFPKSSKEIVEITVGYCDRNIVFKYRGDQ